MQSSVSIPFIFFFPEIRNGSKLNLIHCSEGKGRRGGKKKEIERKRLQENSYYLQSCLSYLQTHIFSETVPFLSRQLKAS